MTEQPQPTPAQPVTNPFRGIPSRDVWRDLGALGLLVAALFYDWSQGDSGAELWYVDIVTVIAIAGLTLTYLAKLGVLGPNWSTGATQVYRSFAALPYGLAIIAVVILDIADDRGVGVGVAVGLAGAVLAGQPRSHELPATVLAPSDGLWVNITAGFAALAAFTVLLTTLLFIDDLDDAGANVAGIVVFAIAGALLAGVLALPAFGVLRRRPQSVALVAGVGIGVLVLGMLHIDDHNLTQFFGWPVLISGWEGIDWPGYGAFLLAGAGAAALSPGASRSTGGAAHPISLIGAAKGAFLLIAVVGLVHALAPLFGLAAFDGADLDGASIATLVCNAIIVGLGLLGFVSTSPNASTKVPVLAAVGYAVVVIALTIAIAIIDDGYVGFVALITGGTGGFATESWLTAVLVAGAIILTLLGPAKVGAAIKQALQNAQTANDSAATAGAPLPGAPVAPAPVVPAPAPAAAAPVAPTPAAPVAAPESVAPEPIADAPSSEESAAPEAAAPVVNPEPAESASEATAVISPVVQEAANPTTSQERLADIAHHHPEARPAVALNPQAYPGLLEWLGSLGDPEIDAALQQRK